MAWNDLSITQRSELISLFLRNGVNDLRKMRELYNNSASSSPLVEATPRPFQTAPVYGEGGTKKSWLKNKLIDLWYNKNVQPKIDELGIDEVRNRLYRNISPYSYIEVDKRIKSALNNELPEFEQFQKRHNADVFTQDRDDIFATYLNIPLEKRRMAGKHPDGTYTNNSPTRVIDSEYKPTKASENEIPYKALTLNYLDKRTLLNMALEGGEDASDYAIEKGNNLGVFPNYEKLKDVVRPPLQIGESRVTNTLRKYFGPHTISRGIDKDRGEYISYYDRWDIAPVFDGTDESKGLGTPIEFYDRIYLDDFYGVNSRPEPDSFYGGYIQPARITAKRKTHGEGGSIHIKPENMRLSLEPRPKAESFVDAFRQKLFDAVDSGKMKKHLKR